MKLLATTTLNSIQRQISSPEILKDIHGSRAGCFYEFGLAKVTDKSDFDIKLFSLKEEWESEFNDWFKRKVMILWLASSRAECMRENRC